MFRRHAAMIALLVVAAGARIAMQMAAMPPYAGLDEFWDALLLRK